MSPFMTGRSKENPDVFWHKNAVRKKRIKQFTFQLEYLYYLHGPKSLLKHVETLILFLTYLKIVSRYNLIHGFFDSNFSVHLNQKLLYLFWRWKEFCARIQLKTGTEMLGCSPKWNKLLMYFSFCDYNVNI